MSAGAHRTDAAADGTAAGTGGTTEAWQPAVSAPGTVGGGTSALAGGAVSCTGTAYCALVGAYDPGGAGVVSGFAWTETNGTWGTAAQIPGLAALNKGGLAAADPLACPSAGDCAAGGSYLAAATGGVVEPFVVSETGGTWSEAVEVPGIAALNTGGRAVLDAISCGAPGDCAAAGTYLTSSEAAAPFLVDETGGRWGRAVAVPSVAALGGTYISSLSCPSAGNCAAVGDSGTGAVAFVLNETGGHWGKAARVTGTSAGPAGLTSVSCAAAGNCVAGGSYTPAAHAAGQALLVTETGGHWGAARTLATGGDAISAVSCPASGDCAVAASGYLASEVKGTWQKPAAVPAAYEATSVSCGAPGDCSAAGYYGAAASEQGSPVFIESGTGVADETGGAWGPWQLIPGAVLVHDPDDSPVDSSVSCGAPGNCAIYGFGEDQKGPFGPWVAGKAVVEATVTRLLLSPARLTYGHEQAGLLSVTVSAGTGTPAGSVTVVSAGITVCVITLSAGRGGCVVPVTRLPAGSRALSAYYGINSGFAYSHSAPVAVVIGKAGTKTALGLARSRVSYGEETPERMAVTVSPQYAGDPTGSVIVRAGKTTLCVIRLASARGSCALSARQLKPGTYRLSAQYTGSADFTPSTSAAQSLTVAS